MSRKTLLHIGERPVGDGAPCYVVAEIGSNHNGSLARAKELIARMAEAGADAVKFQSIRSDRIFMEAFTESYERELHRRIELPAEWHEELAECAAGHRVHFLSAATYDEAVPLLRKVGVPAFKIASPQAVGHLGLVRAIAREGKPLLLSTGYCTYIEIAKAVTLCSEEGNDRIVLLHCVSEYPTPPERANLRAMDTLRSIFGVPIGFSDHTLGIAVPLAAVARGACVVEKHVTLDRAQDGPDHHFALEPAEFVEMVRGIRAIERSLGDGSRAAISDRERTILPTVLTRLVARVAIAAGSPVEEGDLLFRRAPFGLLLDDLPLVRRAVAVEPIPPGTPLTWDRLRIVK